MEIETFKVGEIVRIKPEHRDYFKGFGFYNPVARVKRIVKEGAEKILYFEGLDVGAYSKRVEKFIFIIPPEKRYYKICKKIKEMEERRKQLGYKY